MDFDEKIKEIDKRIIDPVIKSAGNIIKTVGSEGVINPLVNILGDTVVTVIKGTSKNTP